MKPWPHLRETILAALYARGCRRCLHGPARSDVLPKRVPTEGLLILRDGNRESRDITLSPLALITPPPEHREPRIGPPAPGGGGGGGRAEDDT